MLSERNKWIAPQNTGSKIVIWKISRKYSAPATISIRQIRKGRRRDNEDGINGRNGRRHHERQNSGGAEIVAPAKISNAFAIETEVTARPLSGNERFRLFLGVYQGQNGAGCNVANSQAHIHLLRLNGQDGAAIIDVVDTNFHFDPERPTRVA